MRKRLIPTVLSGFLCVWGLAQAARVFGESVALHIHSSNRAVSGGTLGGRGGKCARVDSMALDIVGRDQGDQEAQRFYDVTVWKSPNGRAFFFISGMTIDADGAPNAYNPDDTGLDELANAGAPARWNGLVTDRDGNPLTQQDSDPFPGYYISCTSLSDKTKTFDDPTGYVDASMIPYVALPKDVADWGGAQLGDLAIVINLRNSKWSFAIYADIGTLGEGSVALADVLGIRSDARHGGESDGILYLLFPGSGNLQPRTIGEIQNEGEKSLLDHWSGSKGSYSCVADGDHTLRTRGF